MPLPLGTIVLIPRPGHLPEDEGESMVPAMVIGNWPDDRVRLYTFHYEGSFLVNSIPIADVLAVNDADQALLNSLRQEVADLRALVEDLTAPKHGVSKPGKPIHPPVAAE